MTRICIIGHQKITKYLVDELTNHKFNITQIVCTSSKLKNKVTDHYNFINNNKQYKKINIYKAHKYSLKSNIDKKNISRFNNDIFIVFGWSRLIPEWLLSLNKNVIGMHGGMYKPPRCRGRAVFNWALIGGYKKFYLYVMKLDSGIDSGKIISIDKIPISNEDDIETLYLKYAVNGTKQIKRLISQFSKKSINHIKTSNKKPSYLPKRNPDDGYINLIQKNHNIVNFVKAIKYPFPGAFLFYNKIKINIEELIPFDIDNNKKVRIGSILNVFENKMFSIKSKEGSLLVKKWHVHVNVNWSPKKNMLLKYSKELQIKKLKF